MKNLSLNIRKVGFGLLVALLAVGFSAFKSSEKSVRLTYYYGNLGSGVYQQISSGQADPDVNCRSTDAHPCMLTSDQNLPDGFAIGSPEAPGDATPVSEKSALWYNP